MKTNITNNQKVNEEIEAFVRVLKSNHIPIDKVILFGSYARGLADEASDIDLAVLSESFGKDSIEEMMTLSKLSWQVSDRIESIPLSQKDMAMKYLPLIGELHKYGKVVFSS